MAEGVNIMENNDRQITWHAMDITRERREEQMRSSSSLLKKAGIRCFWMAIMYGSD